MTDGVVLHARLRQKNQLTLPEPVVRATLGVGYFWEQLLNGSGPSNRYEAIGYLWEGHIKMWGNDRLGSKYGDNQPWCYYGPLDSSWNYCP